MTTETFNVKTNSINTTALQLAFIGALHNQPADSSDALVEHLTRQVIHEVYYKDHEFDKQKVHDIEKIAQSFVTGIDKKAAKLGVAIYENNEFGGTLHPNKLNNNFNLVLSEVAKDLCSEFKVLGFKPDYKQEPILKLKVWRFESIISIKLGDQKFIAPMFNQSFYGAYFAVPEKYRDYLLIGFSKEKINEFSGDADIAFADTNESLNPFVMEALKQLCIHESGKCIQEYYRRIVIKTPELLNKLSSISSKFDVSKNSLIEAATTALQLGLSLESNEKPAYLSMLTQYHFGHLDCDAQALLTITQTLIDIAQNTDFESDYSVAPFAVSDRPR